MFGGDKPELIQNCSFVYEYKERKERKQIVTNSPLSVSSPSTPIEESPQSTPSREVNNNNNNNNNNQQIMNDLDNTPTPLSTPARDRIETTKIDRTPKKNLEETVRHSSKEKLKKYDDHDPFLNPNARKNDSPARVPDSLNSLFNRNLATSAPQPQPVVEKPKSNSGDFDSVAAIITKVDPKKKSIKVSKSTGRKSGKILKKEGINFETFDYRDDDSESNAKPTSKYVLVRFIFLSNFNLIYFDYLFIKIILFYFILFYFI